MYNLFSNKTDEELLKSAEGFALAQEDLAGKANEDFTHWHHVGLADLIKELSTRLKNRSPI